MADRVLPRYPIFIPSKGRWQADRALTARCLMEDAIPFKVVIEPQEFDEYEPLVGADQILVLPFSNLGQGSIPARNWIKDYATEAGAERHWQLDDNIIEFRRLFRGERIPVASGVALRACEDFSDRYTNVAISGLNYQMFVTSQTKKPFVTNVHVYSCVAPDTSVLCADLSWRDAGSLTVGTKIVAFDEEPEYAGQGRNSRAYRTATIDRNDPSEKPSLRVTTDIGIPVEASEDHPWLVSRQQALRRASRNGHPGDLSGRHQLCWVETRDLREGDQIAHLARPWMRDETHDGGWISGMWDGEGSLTTQNGGRRRVQLTIAQKGGPVMDRLARTLADRGYEVSIGKSRSIHTLSIGGGFIEALRFGGEFAPTRMLDKLPALWEGRGVRLGQSYELATVTRIESLGTRPVASISTSSGTFVTGGYLTHNCSLVNNSIPHYWRGRYNEDTDICLQVLADGWCTVLLNVFMANKLRTMAMGGGNTDVLYEGDGRLKMARSLERVWPGVVTTERRFGRPQHVIKDAWKKFDTPLILRDGVDLEALAATSNDYGMKLVEKKPLRSDHLRRKLLDPS